MLSLEVVIIGTYLSQSSGSQLNSSLNPEQLLFDRREKGEGYCICNFFVHPNETNILCVRHNAAAAILVFLPVCILFLLQQSREVGEMLGNHFAEEKIEDQRQCVTYPRSHYP